MEGVYRTSQSDSCQKLVMETWKFCLSIFSYKDRRQVTFSFEDPALTGAALAVLGMTIPFHKIIYRSIPVLTVRIICMETSGQKAGSTDLFLCGQQ